MEKEQRKNVNYLMALFEQITINTGVNVLNRLTEGSFSFPFLLLLYKGVL